jgi:hypothetical protein
LVISSVRRAKRENGPFGHAGPLFSNHVSHDVEKPHQFVHVDAPGRFKAGHHRGNEHHHIQDVQEHYGPLHKEEVRRDVIF